GPNRASALDKGCRFDPMSFSWLPVACYDQDLIDDFLDADDWRWYMDMHMSKQADRAGVLTGQHGSLYVTHRYHMYHCLYMWRKLHRAMESGRPIDGYIRDYHHTVHCGEMLLLNDTADQDVDSIIVTKYPTC
ncbi:uncharacterized protein BKA55DRAFT_475236, partial [Fusarium redolens]